MNKLETQKSIGQGKWNEDVSWEFILTQDLPDLSLCTAVCCITVFQGKLLLIKNKRGWELPAGHIEEKESVIQAMQREVKEEAGARIENQLIFGYKKLTAAKPMQKGNSGSFYPFPHSYVVFAYANALSVDQEQLPQDIVERKIVSYSESLQLFSDVSQYQVILNFLLTQQLLELVR